MVKKHSIIIASSLFLGLGLFLASCADEVQKYYNILEDAADSTNDTGGGGGDGGGDGGGGGGGDEVDPTTLVQLTSCDQAETLATLAGLSADGSFWRCIALDDSESQEVDLELEGVGSGTGRMWPDRNLNFLLVNTNENVTYFKGFCSPSHTLYRDGVTNGIILKQVYLSEGSCSLVKAYAPDKFLYIRSGYNISTPEDLENVNILQLDERDWLKITADIDLSGRTYSSALIKKLTANLDGQNHTISNLEIDSSELNVGLIGSLQASEGKSLTIKNLNLGVVNITGFENVGAVVGSVDSRDYNFENINVELTGTLTALSNYASGIVGFVPRSKGAILNFTNIAVTGGGTVSAKQHFSGLASAHFNEKPVHMDFKNILVEINLEGLPGTSLRSGCIANMNSLGSVVNAIVDCDIISTSAIGSTYPTGIISGEITRIENVVAITDTNTGNAWNTAGWNFYASAGQDVVIKNSYMLGNVTMYNDFGWYSAKSLVPKSYTIDSTYFYGGLTRNGNRAPVRTGTAVTASSNMYAYSYTGYPSAPDSNIDEQWIVDGLVFNFSDNSLWTDLDDNSTLPKLLMPADWPTVEPFGGEQGWMSRQTTAINEILLAHPKAVPVP